VFVACREYPSTKNIGEHWSALLIADATGISQSKTRLESFIIGEKFQWKIIFLPNCCSRVLMFFALENRAFLLQPAP
jgi:hypothetical protein